ncbi:MAG: presenilin [Candidatus Bathyarchaeota archaeon]|nr:presenilin [Candidatus Bathyarchaeota archaeon]
MAEEEFKSSPIYLVPILGSLLVSIACASLVLVSEVSMDPVLILPESGYGPLLNGVIFVIAAGSGATLIYLLLKHGVHRFVRALMGFAISVLTFSLVVFYSELVVVVLESIAQVELGVPIAGVLILAALATVFVIVQVVLMKGRFYEMIVLVFGGATGALLGAYIPLLSAVFILVLLAVYDVVAVFRGPVGKIAAKGLEHLPGASFAFRDIHIGLGDITFYSMLVSRVFLSFGLVPCIFAIFGVLVGSYISFKMVEKKGMFPGLPFSIFIGLLTGFGASLLG